MRQLLERVRLTLVEQLFDNEDEDESVHSRRQSPLLGELGTEPTPESHYMVPGAQERLPLGEIGIEPTPESSGPGAQGTPLSPSPQELQESEEQESILTSSGVAASGEVDSHTEGGPGELETTIHESAIQNNQLNSSDDSLIVSFASPDSETQNMFPSIQDKVDKFEIEDKTKRKAETSPELSKKDKKKLKNQEKQQKKQEILEKSRLKLECHFFL